MKIRTIRAALATATALSGALCSTAAWADCVSQAPVNPEQVVCDNPGTAGWNGSSTNNLVVTVLSGANVTTNVGGPALISTGSDSAVINFGGAFDPAGVTTYGIDAGSVTAGAISVGGGSIVTNSSGAAIYGAINFGSATGTTTNILNNNYSTTGGVDNIGLIDGSVSAQGNFTLNNQGVMGWDDSVQISQTGAGTVVIHNGIDGGYLSSFSGAYDYQNALISGVGTVISTEGNTTLVNHGGGGTLGGVIDGDVVLGTGATGSSSLINGSTADGNATIIGDVTMADLNNTVTNDGTITGDVTMNGSGSNTYNAGSSDSSGDNGLRLPGSQIDETGAPTGVVTGTLTGLDTNVAHNVLNLNGTDTSTLQTGVNILNFGVVNKNDAGTWVIKNTLDGAAGALASVNLNAGVLSVDNAAFLGSSATTVNNNSSVLGQGALLFNGTAAGTFAGNIVGTGTVGVTGTNATTLTGTNTYSGATYIDNGTLNANSDGALSSNSDLFMSDGILNVNADVTAKNLFDDTLGSNVINIAADSSLGVAGGDYGDNGGVINGPGSLIKYSTATLILSGSDQIAPGALIVDNGIVDLNDGALDSSTAVQVNSTATTAGVLNVNDSDTIGALAGTGANAAVNLATGANLDVGGLNTSTTFSGIIAGAGSLTKSGSGILSLTGANSYTGGTTVNDGTLMGFVGTGASITGDYTLNNDAFLTFNQLLPASGPQSGTFSGNVTGATTAYMQFIGNSTTTVTLTGDNSGFAGTSTFGGGVSTIGQGGTVAIGSATNIGTGTLQFYDGVLQTTDTMSLANAVSLQTTGGGGTFNTDDGTTLTLSGPVSGDGALLKTGTGTLVLDGISTYTGGTTVSAGTLQGIAGVGIQGDILNNATVILNGSLQTYNGDMSGTGNVVIDGVVGLAGTNTYSGTTTVGEGSELGALSINGLSANSTIILDGALGDLVGGFVDDQTIGALSGGSTGTVQTDGHTLTTGANDASTTFAGQFLTGSGSLVKVGTGTFTLSGTDSELSGNLGVDAGTLSLTGTLAAATTTVASGATLSVDGTLTSPTVGIVAGGKLVGGLGTVAGNVVGDVTNEGAVAPGHSPGILAITGSYTQTSTGTYAAEVLANGTGTVVAGVDYDRIAVTGTPGTATLAGTLALTRNGSLYVAGTNYDIITTTGGISGSFSTVTGATISPFLTLSNATANGGGIQGDSYRLAVVRSAAYNTVATNPNQVAVANGLTGMIGSAGATDTVNKIDNMTGAQAQALFSTLNPEPYAAYATALLDQGNLFTRQVSNRLSLNGSEDRQTGIWIAGYGSWGDGKDRGDYRIGNDHSITGFAAGVEMGSESLRFGVAGGYSEDKVDFLQGNSSGKSKSWQVGGYAGYANSGFRVDGQIAYISGDITASKAVAAGSGVTLIQGTAGVDTNGDVIKGSITVGYDLGGDRFTFTPYAGIDYSNGKVKGFTETGMGALGLTVADIQTDRTDLVVGARLGTDLGSVRPFVNASYRYDLEDHPGAVTAYVNGVSTTSFTVSAIGMGRSAVEVDAGLSAKIGSNVDLYAAYQGAFRNDRDSHGVSAGIRLAF